MAFQVCLTPKPPSSPVPFSALWSPVQTGRPLRGGSQITEPVSFGLSSLVHATPAKSVPEALEASLRSSGASQRLTPSSYCLLSVEFCKWNRHFISVNIAFYGERKQLLSLNASRPCKGSRCPSESSVPSSFSFPSPLLGSHFHQLFRSVLFLFFCSCR